MVRYRTAALRHPAKRKSAGQKPVDGSTATPLADSGGSVHHRLVHQPAAACFPVGCLQIEDAVAGNSVVVQAGDGTQQQCLLLGGVRRPLVHLETDTHDCTNRSNLVGLSK